MLKKIRNTIKYIKWTKSGRPVPTPHIVKQKTILDYAKKYNLQILVETGTYHGDMVMATKNRFKQIYSIELQEDLYNKAVNKFKRYKNINIIQGDSALQLGTILAKINEPCLFWLDGHYSAGETAKGEKETPIVEELEQIFNHHISSHVILIDDAREFTGNNDYPTVNKLSEIISNLTKNYKISIEDDIIRIVNSE